MRYSLVIIALVLLNAISPAQTKEDEKISVSFGGYARTDVVFDSRQNEAIREGYFLRYPLKEELDINGNDLNNKPALGLFSIHSRLTAKVSGGPTVLGAKASGYLETDFFGSSDQVMNVLRMRHFYMEFKWASTSLLLGQYWHPIVVPDAAPTTLSANTGSPIQTFARVPQIKVTQNISDMSFSLAFSSHRDYASDGPSGTSALYLKNALLPEVTLLAQYNFGQSMAGIGGNFKSIVPRIRTAKNISTDERLNSLAAVAWLKIAASDFSWSAKAIYGQNMSNLSMLGGYGVSAVDTSTGFEEYANINTISLWSDLSYGKNVKAGLFAGYTKNLGAGKDIVGAIYGRGKDIDNIFRVSPRVIWNIGKTRFAGELEYTDASYGITQKNAEVGNTKSVSNIRLLLSAFYFF